MAVEEKIGKITGSFIGFEDHGLLSVSHSFDYGDSGQSIAYRAFGSEHEEDPSKWRPGHEAGMNFIRRLLLACGVRRWEDIIGRTVLVRATHVNIEAIRPLPTEHGEPFDINEWAAALPGA